MERKPETIIVTEEMASRINKFNVEIEVFPGDELTPHEPIENINVGHKMYTTSSGYPVWEPETSSSEDRGDN